MHFADRGQGLICGRGRIYTFVYLVTDASGNSTEVSANVTVPHDEGQ
jgi:hypothetical protein